MNDKPTPEQWRKWYQHKSSDELWSKQQEKLQEELEYEKTNK